MKSSDIQDYKNLGYPPHLVLILSTALHVAQTGQSRFRQLCSEKSILLPERDVVGDDAQQVDHVHALLDEVPLEGGGHEPVWKNVF